MRVAIVNDMPMAVEALRRAILANDANQIAWTAWSGEEAIKQCANDLPDLILMDMIMPGMSGVEATEKIMNSTPCPILIVTASVGKNSGMVFEAMGKGALDAVNTPLLADNEDDGEREELLHKISLIEVLTQDSTSTYTSGEYKQMPLNTNGTNLLAIGSSSGGPKALAVLLQSLPSDFSASVVIVQHVDAQFSQGLADWLNQQTELPVRLAREGDKPKPGEVLLAGTNNHLVMSESGELHYQEEPMDMPYRPSVDVFWCSLKKNWSGSITAVLLTGMGKDGAQGMLELRRKGAYTIAQDEQTSTVFGMPKAAIENDAVEDVLALEDIGPVICAKQEVKLQG